MKLCVIGNSHAGMLVRAAREAPPEGVELTFFARSGRGPEGVRMRNGQLRAVTAELKRALARFGMPESVDLRAQDAFVLVGMTATVFSVLPMLQGHRVFGWPPEAGDGARRLVSEAALEAALVAEIAGGLAAEYVARIRRVSAAPIVLVAQPAPSEAAAGAGARHGGLRRILRAGQGAAVAACLARAHARVFDGAGLHLLAQPPETLVGDAFTAASWMRGAGRLNPEGRLPDEDILHANAAYGGLVLDRVLSDLRKIVAKSDG
ncbi:hypothetical protein [Seohaeicola zhoushanensis]|uniref:Uncharacterized protein n=1 Tax=Seohaeicola zhoushanensis TaxID=1569283 RepID=A0A8J3GW60_9RHOB|nr:hypothetical protein [Seohaeicola zhoushanensis]GHF47150.1 hypothetical protein GCM10017056_18570 [Seohaeicola zhoushanensis]